LCTVRKASLSYVDNANFTKTCKASLSRTDNAIFTKTCKASLSHIDKASLSYTDNETLMRSLLKLKNQV